MVLEEGWYLINDEELFLFATSGFWDKLERMSTYKKVKERYCGKEEPKGIQIKEVNGAGH